MITPRRIYLDMVGCRLNQAELERLAAQATQAGHKLVATMADADLAIFNTCAVTSKAGAESRKLARKANRMGVDEVVLTGCWASLDPAWAKSLPAVSHVFPNEQKDLISHYLFGERRPITLRDSIDRSELPGPRKRTRAFIKIQDGCDRHCSFCVTTIVRGRGRSEPLRSILSEIQSAASAGIREVVLTGVHLGSWGSDFEERTTLADLLRAVLSDTDVPRVRLSSLEPWGITGDLLGLWENPRLCQQIHLPLQSGSAEILRRMGRNTSPGKYRSLVQRIRMHYPLIAITTDIIVGFPGESNDEFTSSMNFVSEMRFSRGHVFSYSERPETRAARFTGAIPHELRRERNARMQQVIERSASLYRADFVGCTLSVLWERLSRNNVSDTLSGWSSEGLRVRAHGHPYDLNRITPVRISHLDGLGRLVGKILTIPPPRA